jgi:hypothetical protein
MRTASILLFAAAAGCATNNHRSGVNQTFNCSGTGTGWDDCTKQADALCGARGYDVVERNLDSVTGASGISETKRELVVACK